MIDKRRNRNKVIIIIVFILLIVGMIYLLLPSKGKITVINENLETVVFKHDSNWKLKEKENNLILLKNAGGSQLKIQITTINNDNKYSSIDELVDELVYNIQSQNKNYKLISKKNETVTANMYNSYKFLFENDDEQVMVVVYKIGDKLVSYIYEASNDYFDILLDSVHSIINSLSIKDESYELGDNIKLNLENISYPSNADFDKLLTDTKTYKTANYHYLIEYEIPSILKMKSVDSSHGDYEYKLNFSNKIEMRFRIYGKNIYSYFDEDEYNIYSNCSYYRNNESGESSNFKEVISKYDSEYNSYIYRCSWDYKSKYDEDIIKEEKIYLLFAIDNYVTLEVEIESDNFPITKKMLDMIKIKNVTNYSSYILNNKEGNNLVGELKEFTDYDYNKIRTVKLLIPDKYQEIDRGWGAFANIYEYRSYRLNFDDTYDLYDYEIEYQLDHSIEYTEKTIKSRVDIFNTSIIVTTYGKYQYLTFTKKITLNGKVFYMYDGGYTDRSGVLFKNSRKDYYKYIKVLYYIASDKSAVEITIDGNGKKITDDILKEVTNFTINEESV